MRMFRLKQTYEVPNSAQEPRLPALALQELWFATLRSNWTTLAIVPADTGTSVLGLARALGEFGGRHRGKPLSVMSAAGLDLASIGNLIAGLDPMGSAAESARGGKVILALDPISENPMGIAAAMAADALLLCVELGKTSLRGARHTIEQLGRDRLIGCVVLGR